MKAMSILTDVTLCVGCERCVAACKKTNHTGRDRPWPWQRKIDDLSASRWTTLIRVPGERHVRQQCRHCLEPACVSACPVGALQKKPEGPVVYDPKICMGCRYCMMSCPFGIPRYLWSEAVPYIRKCTLCYPKISSGTLLEPACTQACPTGATRFGTRDALLEEAHRRIREEPGRYLDRVWGESEVGGTSVLYISDVPLDAPGLQKDLGSASLPLKTWAALRQVPGTFLGVGACMYGLYWIIERRQRLASPGADSPESPQEQKSEIAGNQGQPGGNQA